MNKRSVSRTLLFLVLLGAWLQGCTPVMVAKDGSTQVVEENDRRSSGTVLEDQGIEIGLTKKIRSQPQLADKVHITVTSYNLQVLLTGEAPSAALRDQILTLASNADRVRNVFNAITISEPTEFSSRNNDTWITSKVKARMLASTDVDATRIKVLTEKSWVYLMGLVTPQEAERAAKIASEVNGVHRVVKVFEYIK